MNVRRFSARTSRDALNLVRQALGDDAVVLSTKPSADGVEVLAMAPDSMAQIERLASPAPAPRVAVPPSPAPAPTASAPADKPAPRPPLAARVAARIAAHAKERMEPNFGASGTTGASGSGGNARSARNAPRVDREPVFGDEAPAPVADDVEQLAMSTLSFQDYVRERMLRKRDAALKAEAAASAAAAAERATEAGPLARRMAQRQSGAAEVAPAPPRGVVSPIRPDPRRNPPADANADLRPEPRQDARHDPRLTAHREPPVLRDEVARGPARTAATAAADGHAAAHAGLRPTTPAAGQRVAAEAPSGDYAGQATHGAYAGQATHGAYSAQTPQGAYSAQTPAAVHAASAPAGRYAPPSAPAPSLADAGAARRDQQDMMAELRNVKGLIEERFGALAFMEKLQRQPAQAHLIQRLLACGFSPALVRKLGESMSADVADEMAWAAGVLQRNLSAVETGPGIEDEGGAFALVGATGVGKTTTTAKIAAAFAAKYGAGNLGLITLDAYRVGAHEQLRAYGRILGVPVHTAHDRASLEDLLDLLGAKRMVLIDTAGMAQRDSRTRELLDMVSHRAVRKLVVLNAAAQGETTEDVLLAYNARQAHGVVLSKVDEAVKLAPALDALIRHKIPVIGVGNGQRVPEDWHRLSAQALIQRALHTAAGSAWHLDSSDVSLIVAPSAAAGRAAAVHV